MQIRARKHAGRHFGDDLLAPSRHDDGDAPAAKEQQRAFGQKLPNHSSARAAQSRAHRDFSVTLHTASQKQTRDVGAGDQKHNSRRDRRHPQTAPGILHCRPGVLAHFFKVFHHEAISLIGRRTRIFELASDDFGFRTRLPQRRARLQARDDLDSHFSCSDISLACVRVQNQRSKDLKLLVIRSQGLRQYANNRNWTAIQNNLLSCNLRVGVKSSVPAVVGKHHHRVLAGDLFFLSKVAAQQWLNAERG